MGIFSAVGEKNAARDMALMDTKGDDTSQEFTKYEGHDRSTKKVNVSDGLLQQARCGRLEDRTIESRIADNARQPSSRRGTAHPRFACGH
eukprot:6427718-Prymnesium_polylepis.2